MFIFFLLDSCREDNPRAACVIDKINIFRPDRVFMVILKFHIIYIYIFFPFLDLSNFPFELQIYSSAVNISFAFCGMNYCFDHAVYSRNAL
jgi:hypothetical protein